jgi:hypothetical protein
LKQEGQAYYEKKHKKMIVVALPKRKPASAGMNQCVSGPLDLQRGTQEAFIRNLIMRTIQTRTAILAWQC